MKSRMPKEVSRLIKRSHFDKHLRDIIHAWRNTFWTIIIEDLVLLEQYGYSQGDLSCIIVAINCEVIGGTQVSEFMPWNRFSPAIEWGIKLLREFKPKYSYTIHHSACGGTLVVSPVPSDKSNEVFCYNSEISKCDKCGGWTLDYATSLYQQYLIGFCSNVKLRHRRNLLVGEGIANDI